MNAPSRRYFIELAYDGTNYHGWQVQDNAITVQQKLNEALHVLLREEVETLGCGRTDTGVHARQLYAHFDLPEVTKIGSAGKFLHALNALLPKDIAVKRLLPVAADAHARFDALSRSYEYHIHTGKDPFLEGYSWRLRDEPDLDVMNAAAALMLPYRDFSCFSKSNTQVFTNNCHIIRAEWVRTGPLHLVFHITANRFLRNMVRAIVGTLMDIWRNDRPVEYMKEVIESKDRSIAGASVPACGLYLSQVVYPYLEEEEWP